MVATSSGTPTRAVRYRFSGSKLRSVRRALGWSRRDLEHRTIALGRDHRISSETVERIETSVVAHTSLRTAVVLAEVLGVAFADLLE